MAIVFGGDVGIRPNTLTGFVDKITSEFNRVKTGLLENFNRLTGESAGLPPPPEKERVFVDDGFTNVPGTAFVGSRIEGVDDIKERRITTQEPQLTVYIKKRAFWSLRNENDTRFMDPGEKLFIRASKILFETKCSQIAAYEALTKASRLISEDAELDSARIEQVADALEGFFDNFSDSVNSDVITALAQESTNIAQDLFSQAQMIKEDRAKLIDGLRNLVRAQRKLKQSTHTNWVVDPDNGTDVLSVGRGSGVIELTSITNLSTDLSLEYGSLGQVQFSLEDPYNLTKITSDNVEIALSAAYREQRALDSNNSDVSFLELGGPQNILENARRKDEQLTKIRRNRINNAFGLSGNGTSLSGSDTTDIVFEINPSSFAKEKVIGSTPALSETFNKNSFRIILLQLPVEQRLTLEEDRLVVEIFGLLEQYVAEVQRLNTSILENNSRSEVKYARRHLRLHYLGKSIIQPMDGVHVYMRGNTFKDSELIGPLSSLLNNTNFIRSFAEDNNASDAVLQEEMRQFGLEDLKIPLQLYREIRTGSFMRNAGIHVFGGLISSVSESYNPDKGYVLNISGESNMKWLNLSRTNTAPALSQPNGVLEDPLTPLDLNNAIDKGTGLLKEKPPPLDSNATKINDGSLIFAFGPNKGKAIASPNDLEQDFIPFGDRILPIVNHAPGLTYRWKEGVLAITRNVNLRTPLDGSGVKSAKLAQEVGISIAPNPFANLDAADVVSSLVTGFPHNYESFVLNSRSIGTFSFNTQANTGESYFHSFFDITRRTNKALGNFQPFKIINITPQQMAKRISLQTALKEQSKQLAELRSQLAKALDDFNSINSPIEQLDNSNDALRKQSITGSIFIIQSLKSQINNITNAFVNNIKSAKDEGLRVYGNDILLSFENSTSSSTKEDIDESSKRARLKNELLQLRTQLRCKFNTDTNLFIVSDDYDKDLDIQAFIIESLTSKEPSLWDNTQYKHPLEICINVAKTLDFEFFCDSQGHIQFRPPKYNKLPLSLVLKLFLLDQTQNKKLYPVFLEQLFKDRINSFKDESERIDIEIKIQNILLNKPVEDKGQADTDIVDPNSFVVGVGDLLEANSVKTSDAKEKDANRTLIELRNDLTSRIGGTPIEINEQSLDVASKEIKDLNDPSSSNVNARRLGEINKLAQLESRKQTILSTLKKLKAQTDKFQTSIDGAPLQTQRLSEGQMKDLLAPFAELVEDDFNDFLGPNSSKRFIIDDDQIISSSFTESDQNVFCRYDVTGEQDLTGEGAGILGGVPIMWAGAVDFDLWRQYGWRAEGSINKPFFKDAELQCAPYALMLLSRARRDAVRGNITIYGNEYYQLGDVVYVNSRDMLYYVVGVKHSFAYDSGNFSTTLDLRYGHPLGEYIPGPLDVIGKNLIKNMRNFNMRTTTRQTASKSLGVSLGIVIFSSSMPDDTADLVNIDSFSEMLGGDIGKFNLVELKNALLKARDHIIDGQEFPKLDIRGFVTDKIDIPLVSDRIDAVRSWFVSPRTSEGPLPTEDYPLIPLASIREIDEELDPIDMTNLQEDNAINGRIPREEVYNAVGGRTLSNIIEIMLIFQ